MHLCWGNPEAGQTDMRREEHKVKAGRRYVIYLSKYRSILALSACLITITFSFYGIAGGIVLYTKDGMSAGLLFEWFTTISNSITCLSACMITPFAVEGIRRKHFSFPKWISLFLYAGMVCTTLTMVMSVGFMSWTDPELAFGGYNTYLHIVCPVMVIISFFMVESGFRYTVKDALMATVPTFLYVMVYSFEVAIVGEENGGWEDIYHVMDYMPVAVAAVGVPLVAFGISLLIMLFNNIRVKRLRRKLMSSLWPKGVSPAIINVEVFGLGRYMGKHSDIEFVELYMDIINDIATYYDIKAEDLVRPYIKGYLDSFNEKNNPKV